MDPISYAKAVSAENKVKELANKTAVTISHQFADGTARDAYFTANPTELVDNLFVKVGTGYQQYINGAWVDSSPIITEVVKAVDQPITDAGGYYTATNTEDALQEIAENIATHLNDYATQQKYNDARLKAVGGVLPSYATLSALQSAFPTGNTNFYVVTADGKWYYWNGSAWIAGGTYQSTGIPPLSLSSAKLVDGLITPEKTNFLKLSTNLLNHYTALKDKSINTSTGAVIDNFGGNSCSDFIPIKPNTVYTSYRVNRAGFYDENKAFISTTTQDGTWTSPNNAYYMRFIGITTYFGISAKLNLGSVSLPYEPYYSYIYADNLEPKTINAKKLTNSTFKCIITGDLVDFRFSISLIDFVNLRLTFDNYNILINQSLDISDLNNVYVYVLYYDVSTNILGTTHLASVPVIPDSCVPICAFRKFDKGIWGLENYKINGKPRYTVKPVDCDMIDVDINKTFNKNATMPDKSIEASTYKGADIYNLYDDLVAQYPSYITKTLLGNETSPDALPIYRYDFKPLRPETATETKQVKYLITSGTHPERTGVWSLYNTMENICNHWQEDELLEALRFNVHFIIVPVMSPWAYDNNSRVNYNGVDLARNFPAGWVQGTFGDATYGGTTPLSEVEAQVVNQIMLDNLDLTGVIDFHNFDAADGRYLWGACANMFTRNIMMNQIQRMTRKWRKEYPFINQNINTFVGNVNGESPYGSLGTQANAYGIKGALTYEAGPKIFADENSTSNDSISLTLAYEGFVNFLLMFTNELLKHS